jgi:hypothetical protein
MATFQALLAIVVLIFALSVMVQAVQEIVKSALGTKADVMAKTMTKFMRDLLTVPQIEGALKVKGLDLTALENFSKDDFRHLLNGIDFSNQPLKGIIADASATLEQKKDNIAAAYEAARTSFQKAYTTKNKLFALAISFAIVLALNANLLMLYEEVAADQVMSQAIVGKASSLVSPNSPPADNTSLEDTYRSSRKTIGDAMAKFPPLVRDSSYGKDFSERPATAIVGLLFMGILVSLGAPFWNDVLKGMTGINNALNTSTKG